MKNQNNYYKNIYMKGDERMSDNNEQFLLKRINKMKNPVSITEFIALDGFSAIKKSC